MLDEGLERNGREVRMDQQHVGHLADQCHRRETPLGVILQVPVQVGIGHGAGSDFGNSIGRPVACFIVTMLALVALAYEVGTRVARKDVELYGWQLALKDDEFLRAAQYAMQSINPLNLFGSPLVVMSQKWGAIAGGTLGVIGVAAFALFFLSVRRRFKLE
jgi:hypothetical protein